MKKLMITVAASLLLVLGTVAGASAALPAGSVLSIDPGTGGSGAPGTGSAFSMEVSPGFFLWTDISGFNGVVLGNLQTASGSHAGPPNGTESPTVDNPWSFFGNTGMHQTVVTPVTDNGDGTANMTGWGVTWNGIPNIPMGGDPANFPVDTGLATLTVTGGNYSLDHCAHVPLGDPSGFGGVQYCVHLEGTVAIPSEPLANGTILTINAGTAGEGAPGTGSAFGMGVAPGVFVWTDISGLEGVILGQLQPASGSHTGAPDGTESPSVDNPWSFFGNTGMHQVTGTPVTDSGGSLNMSGWGVAWNAIPNIPMGGDPANFPEDTSAAMIGVSGDSYTVDYNSHVPLGDPSGFGGVPYALHLEGTVVRSGLCDTVYCGDSLFCNGIETCDPATGECVPGDYPCPGQTCDEDLDICVGCDGISAQTIRGGGQRPTTTDLQIQVEFTVLGSGAIVDSSTSTVTVCSGTVLAFNCKVGQGPDPDYGELDGLPLDTDSLGVIVCDDTVSGDGSHKLYLTNKGNGGRDTDRITIKLAK